MKGGGLRQSMAWIHTWLGLLAGWLLFAMFLTGTASYFRPEITRWMQPELRPVAAPPAQAAASAVRWLQANGAHDEQWTIFLPDDRTTATRIFQRARPPADGSKPPRKPEVRLDPASGQPIAARDTKGGEHFYRFHFQLQLPHPWGRWLAGLAALFMLGAIVSGVITHRRIFADFFTLRWNKGQRSWLDAHNASAVLALPFHAMITYTGLITLIVMYMPWPIAANYSSPSAFSDSLSGIEDAGKATGQPGRLVAVAPLVARAQGEWGGRAAQIVIRNPDDSASTVTVRRTSADTLNARGAFVTYGGIDGRRIAGSSAAGPAAQTAGVMLGLHLGHFAGPALRWVYFLLGLTGAAMVATGLLLWTSKRLTIGERPALGYRIVERLNIGVVACLPAGMAAFLLANRLLPADLAGRAAIEVATMFWVWFGLAALQLARPVRRAWIETLTIAALAFAAVPLVNAATTDRGLLRSAIDGDGLFVAFDIVMLSAAALLGFAARKAHAHVGVAKTRAVRRRRRGQAAQELADAA
ncbi:MAG: PepSY-associated TM helix domain-containing protein [Pseudomonadota bacterium]